MSLADLSIKRPTFITCIVFFMIAVGLLALKTLPVDLFPDVTFPIVSITTEYRGAGPAEIETLVTRVLEDELSTISGVKRLSSTSFDGLSRVVAEFTLETDVKYAEQRVRDKVSSAKSRLPLDAKEPTIRRLDPADQPVVMLALNADLPENELYDLANEVLKPKFEQVPQVGLVDIVGGRKREIHILLDRKKLKEHDLSVIQIASRLGQAGENVPNGKIIKNGKESVIRTLGEFRSLSDIRDTIVNFYGNDVPTTIKDIGSVSNGLQDTTTRAFINGKKGLFINIYRQSGSNTIAVVEAIKKRVEALNHETQAHLEIVRDGSMWIKMNVDDVNESILLGILLAVIVVYFFLGNGRSTIITGLALPNSLIGSFVLMQMAGYSINMMTLLALSLSVGLLIDDAIVVRENIFRHLELGESPKDAARNGTLEVQLAVIATTLAVVAVFGPIAFLKGVVGQFFRQFGMTICFAMCISLFDALTIAPMLSAYFAGVSHTKTKLPIIGPTLDAFDRFQSFLERLYERVIKIALTYPLSTIGFAILIFLGSIKLTGSVTKTFMPTQDSGEFSVDLDLPPGTSVDTMMEVALKADQMLSQHPEVATRAVTIGGMNGQSEVASIYVRLKPSKIRGMTTSAFKERIRQEFKSMSAAHPKIKDFDAISGGMRPYTVTLVSQSQEDLERVATTALALLKNNTNLKDVDMSYRPGKPEIQIHLRRQQSQDLGMSSKLLGMELRSMVDGQIPAKFREMGREYDIRVRLREDQRDIQEDFNETFVPNINQSLVKLATITRLESKTGPATITRQDRGRTISLTADIAPGGGMGQAIEDTRHILDPILPQGMHYAFVGQAENFQELGESVAIAMGLGILFIFLVLASLYESFITPITILVAIPLAICGSLVALYITHESLNVFSMIGVIMLIGVASKNSILLVDSAQHAITQGHNRVDAITKAGITRLRPILMTSMALIAGTIPVALGLNEASRQRTSMGIAIIGGLVSSTILTLIIVPAVFVYIDRFRCFVDRVWKKS